MDIKISKNTLVLNCDTFIIFFEKIIENSGQMTIGKTLYGRFSQGIRNPRAFFPNYRKVGNKKNRVKSEICPNSTTDIREFGQSWLFCYRGAFGTLPNNIDGAFSLD